MQKYTSFSNPRNFPCSIIKSLISFFSSIPETPNPNSVFLNYLIESFNFPKSRALAVSNRYFYVKSLEKSHSVCQFFKRVGFSDAQIQATVRSKPQLLLYDVDKILKPKIEFFQNLGVPGSYLGKLISMNLTNSLEKKLIPCTEILKQVLVDDKNNENLIRILRRNSMLFGHPISRLLTNIQLLKSCGIVGSQLSNLLIVQPRIFFMKEFKLKELVSKVLDMGFSVDSRMFVHGLHSFSCLSEETFEKKLELFRSFGFSRDEFLEMIRKAPSLLVVSVEKLKLGLEFFLETVGLEKAALYNTPLCLMFSMENRVLPRYRVFKILSSRRLLKKECSLPKMLLLTEEKFLHKFVWRFGDDAEALLLAYKGRSLGTYSSKEKS